MLIACCCASPSQHLPSPSFSVYIHSPIFFPHQCLPPCSRSQLTQARTPKRSDQRRFKPDRVQQVQPVVTWVLLLLMHNLEQPHRYFPQAQSLSFAQKPLGQYHCEVKECWNKQNFKRTKYRQNTFLLGSREVQSRSGMRGHTGQPPSMTLGSWDINTLKNLL